MDVLTNDISNPPARPLTVVGIISQPSFGACFITPNRQAIQYQRPTNTIITGTVACKYRVCTNDSLATACDTAVVTIRLTANPTRRPTKRPVFPHVPDELSPTLHPSEYTINFILTL